jgi:hypothetical protein
VGRPQNKLLPIASPGTDEYLNGGMEANSIGKVCLIDRLLHTILGTNPKLQARRNGRCTQGTLAILKRMRFVILFAIDILFSDVLVFSCFSDYSCRALFLFRVHRFKAHFGVIRCF